MRFEPLCLALGVLSAAGCGQESRLELLGSTEWDRNTVLAERSEPVLAWHVAEGDFVEAGDLLLELDPARTEARVAEAEARLAEAEAYLAELRHGPRQEAIANARAQLDNADAAVVDAELEYGRVAELFERELIAESRVDRALAARDQRRAAVRAAEAVLDELLAGTRSEQIDQAAARAQRIRAELTELRLTRARLSVQAPRSGRIDALPFKPGDQPRVGDQVASLLVGERPFARVFIPARVRVAFSPGDVFEVEVEGVAPPLRGVLRRIRSEASFTPYYALTGDDAERLVYRAELELEDERAAELPAGLPLLARPVPAPGDDG